MTLTEIAALAVVALLGATTQPCNYSGGSMGAMSQAAQEAEAAYDRATQSQGFQEFQPILPSGYWLSR